MVPNPQAACKVRGLAGPCATRFAMCAKCFLKSLTSYQDTRRIWGKQLQGEGFCGQGRPIRRVVQVAAMHHTRRCCCNGQSSNGVNMPRPNKTKLGYGRNRSLQTCRRTVGQLPSQRHCIGWSSHKTPLHTSVPLPDRQWPDGRQTHLGSRAVCPWETCRVVDAKLSSAETMGPTEREKDKNVASKRGQRPPWSGIFSL